MCEAAGVPVGLTVAGANRHDMKLVRETIRSIPIPRPRPTRKRPQGMCLDKGYDYNEVRAILKRFGFTDHISERGVPAPAVKKRKRFKARRWVVERSHSWMNRFRRILVRWEKKPENYVALLHLSLALIAFKCSGLLLG